MRPSQRCDPATETTCRHCGAYIRKQRSSDSRAQEWVSFAPSDVGGRPWPAELALANGIYDDPSWYSRFCHREIAEKLGGRRIQHAPPARVPIDNLEKLERWLDS